MSDMTLEEMKQIKKQRGYTLKMISEYTGLPVLTIQKIFAGNTKKPHKRTMEALERVLLGDENIYRGKAFLRAGYMGATRHGEDTDRIHQDASGDGAGNIGNAGDTGDAGNTGDTGSAGNKDKTGDIGGVRAQMSAQMNVQTSSLEVEKKRSLVHETSRYQRDPGELCHKYPLQGSYTAEDYFALPDEQRVELIDGVFYDMASPTILHQDIIFYFQMKIYQYISEKEKRCKVIQAPLDVQLDKDERTIVQPDLLVLCDRGKVKNGRIFGAPEFALEVLLPSTRNKDMTLKVKKYGEAGVQEYWIFDPDKRVLITYNFAKDDFLPQIHPLSDTVPLMMTGGELMIELMPLNGILDEWEGTEESGTGEV